MTIQDSRGNLHAVDGTFTDKVGLAPEVNLAANARSSQAVADFQERRALLVKQGYAAASTGVALGDVRDRKPIDAWWEQNAVLGEFAPAGANTFALMPDDYTPAMTGGKSTEGNRRTHRVLYEGAGVAMRMPSATAMKRFSQENGGRTFDVPVSVEIDGQQVAGHVRVTRNGANEWGVSAAAFPGDKAERVSEAVSAVLESRRPSVALSQVDDLIERRRSRLAQAGAKIVPVRSSFIEGIGYNEHGNELFVTMSNGSSYAYHAPKDVYHAVVNSESPGKAYNDYVKRSADLVAGGKNNPNQVGYDERSGRYFNKARGFRFNRQTEADASEKRGRTIALKRVLGSRAA